MQAPANLVVIIIIIIIIIIIVIIIIIIIIIITIIIIICNLQNLVREGPRSLQNQSGTLSVRARAKKIQKIGFRAQKAHSELLPGAILAPFGVPAGSPKSTKNGPGAEKARPETAPEAIFSVSSCR